jgi:hypothetical protein
MQGVVRPLGPDDPRNLSHPCHREQFLELARAIGRALADQAYDELIQRRRGNDAEGRRDLRQVFD